MEFGWRAGRNAHCGSSGDFAVNLNGRTGPTRRGHPEKGDQKYAYQVGIGDRASSRRSMTGSQRFLAALARASIRSIRTWVDVGPVRQPRQHAGVACARQVTP